MTTAYVLAHYLYLANDIRSDTKQIARRRAQGTTETRDQAGCTPFKTPHVQLIDLMCEDMAFHKDYFSQHKLFLPGSDPVSVAINRGVIIKCQDMKITQEEADVTNLCQ